MEFIISLLVGYVVGAILVVAVLTEGFKNK